MLLFGPVPPSRLGRSLGINNIPPKRCSYSCLYCQLGPTKATESGLSSFYEPAYIYDQVVKRLQLLKVRHEKDQTMSYKIYFDRIDAELLKISPRRDIMLVMTVTLVDGAPLSGAMVAWFIGLGLYISFTIIRKNREKIESLIQEGKKTAQVLQGDHIEEIPISRIRQNDRVLVPKGAVVPIDGTIIEGASSLDESFITGEPFPVNKKNGNSVISGTLNLTAPLQVQAVKNGDESFIAVITGEIEKSLLNKSELQRRADTTVQILLLSVIAYAFLLLFMTGSLHLMATALAVVCPCAWALATPTAFAANIGRLARSNILARGGEPLENMQDIKTLILDKTGTVTLAEPEVSRVIEMGLPKQQLLELAASIESRFEHPIAHSILHFAKKQGVTRFHTVEHAEDLPGRGIKARIEGQEILLGSAETLSFQDIELPTIDYTGRAIWLAVNKEVKGMIVIRDIMLAEMRGLADTIHACGIEQVILATGDNEEPEAKRVAHFIHADAYYFRCTPDDKTELVKKFQASGKTAMVGDGVNDAPALAATNVGIAIGGHKNVNLAIISSDVVILGHDAQDLVTILRLSHKMGNIIRQNYLWAVSFNSIGLALATFGFLNPVVAALLHHVSSVFVVVNAGRLYFTGIEQSFVGPLFRKMDELTNQKRICRELIV